MMMVVWNSSSKDLSKPDGGGKVKEKTTDNVVKLPAQV
jgi:hypothetical protein